LKRIGKISASWKGAADSYEASKAAYTEALIIASLLVGFTGLVLAGAIWFAVSGIASPVQIITAAMNRLAGGDTESRIPYAGRTVRSAKWQRQSRCSGTSALNNLRLEQEATAERSASEEQQRVLAAEEKKRADAMAQATQGLADGLKHLSAGNLSFSINTPFTPDFEGLREDFNAACQRLCETLAEVAGATSAIDSGAREISRSADDLSKRTEQQAASLEETAAALDEITTNVGNASHRVQEARNVAQQANQSASHSGAVVAKAVDAMEKIEQSSGQISSIIGFIDDIAFQTNLLALNAGVEAARAGEAGKGFAVVAREVRELAQRSAKAAKEIKELVQNSSVEVRSGVELVSETGESLKTIQSYVTSINQHMEAIATSAREQSTGLTEVNTAVNQMDQVTQQNAAMVEETNAAGATLAHEAGRLRELVGLSYSTTPDAATLCRRSGRAGLQRPNRSRLRLPRGACSTRFRRPSLARLQRQSQPTAGTSSDQLPQWPGEDTSPPGIPPGQRDFVSRHQFALALGEQEP